MIRERLLCFLRKNWDCFFDNLMTIYIILYILDNIYINLIYMDEILFLISLVREWLCDES